MTRPEQSNVSGPSSPQTYGLPNWARASLIIHCRVSSAPAETSATNKAKINICIKLYKYNKRNKVVVQNIPSINYRINGSFASAQQNMSVPKDFVINQYQKEQMKKVG